MSSPRNYGEKSHKSIIDSWRHTHFLPYSPPLSPNHSLPTSPPISQILDNTPMPPSPNSPNLTSSSLHPHTSIPNLHENRLHELLHLSNLLDINIQHAIELTCHSPSSTPSTHPPFLDQMTTSVVTNSVFRGFFEKQKLTRPNFIDWYRQLRIVLSVEDKLDYLEHPIPPAPVPAQAGQQVAPEALAAHTTWVKGSKEIVGLMLMTMELDIQRNLENLSAYDMLQELKTLFAQQAEHELL
ncbi:hypothetical protein Tco_1146785 [Tanacetum coccineum]